MYSALLSALHVLALGVGLGAVFARGRAFRRRDVEAAFYADNWWGIAALLWIGSGLARAFGGFEKGTAWYMHNPMFHAKMGLYLLLALLEMWPMVTLIRMRIARRRGQPVNAEILGRFVRINDLELVGVVLMPFLAAMMARGIRW